MKVLNTVLYILYVISLISFILSLLLLIGAGVYRVFAGHELMLLHGLRLAIAGDSLAMLLLCAFISNQVDKIIRRNER